MAQHARLKIDAGMQVYFCDPRSPWQRATNENTNGPLRQYFPKGTDLSVHSDEEPQWPSPSRPDPERRSAGNARRDA
jgi:IS30 family transposase